MPLIREIGRTAYEYVDPRLRAEQRAAEGGLSEKRVRERAGELLDEWVAAANTRQVAAGRHPFNREEEREIRAIVLRRLFGLGDLEPLLADPDVENVYLNGFDSVWVESRSKGMQRMASPVAESDEELIILIQRLAARESTQERRWDTAQPILDLTLRDGSRLHAVREVVRRPTVTIRLHRLLKLTLDDLVQSQVIDQRGSELLRAAIAGRQTVVISGATGAGKTTTALALASCIPPEVRIVTVEDTYELHLDRDVDAHPNCVAMQARQANVEGRGRIPAGELFEAALRMAPGRPDRGGGPPARGGGADAGRHRCRRCGGLDQHHPRPQPHPGAQPLPVPGPAGAGQDPDGGERPHDRRRHRLRHPDHGPA